MKLEQQVVSLELAKKLKTLGVEQDSLYYWSDQLNQHITREQFLAYDPYNEDLLQDDGFREAVDRTYSAFTVAELGEMLPANIYSSNGKQWTLHIAKYSLDWEVWYELGGMRADYAWIANVLADTEADARAKMLIYLIENKLISTDSNLGY